MKIAIAIEHFNPKRGGAETYTAYLVSKLAADGHEVSIFTEDWALEPARVAMVRVPVKGITAASRALSFATEASQLAADGGFDVVHSMARILKLSVFQPHGGVMQASIAQSLASSGSGLQRELRKAARWLNTKSDMLLELERIIYEEAKPPRFVAVSNMVADDMKKYHDVSADKIDVVYNGVDVNRFKPENRTAAREPVRKALGIGDDDVLLLLVAHNFRLKGVEVFIRTLAELAKRGRTGVRGLVVGAGEEHVYRGLAAKVGVTDKVVFHHAASDIERFYAAADVYLHPTFYDPMSLVALEALASGLPVVTTRFNGVSEILTHGTNGFVIDEPRNIPAILEAVESLLDKRRRDDMGHAARVLAEEFPLERNYRGIMEVYSRAAAEGAGTDARIRRGG